MIGNTPLAVVADYVLVFVVFLSGINLQVGCD